MEIAPMRTSMQNFSDEHVPVIEGAITVPTCGGAEAFVDAADIAAVAVETLVDPDAHAGAQYVPIGPQSLTVSDVADIIADVIGDQSPTTTSTLTHGSAVRSQPASYPPTTP
jgi:uncharacterized protein YbjT (DUF2867 family)